MHLTHVPPVIISAAFARCCGSIWIFPFLVQSSVRASHVCGCVSWATCCEEHKKKKWNRNACFSAGQVAFSFSIWTFAQSVTKHFIQMLSAQGINTGKEQVDQKARLPAAIKLSCSCTLWRHSRTRYATKSTFKELFFQLKMRILHEKNESNCIPFSVFYYREKKYMFWPFFVYVKPHTFLQYNFTCFLFLILISRYMITTLRYTFHLFETTITLHIRFYNISTEPIWLHRMKNVCMHIFRLNELSFINLRYPDTEFAEDGYSLGYCFLKQATHCSSMMKLIAVKQLRGLSNLASPSGGS